MCQARSLIKLTQTFDISGGAVADPAVKLGLFLELLAARAGHHKEAAVRLGKRAHVAPELFELSYRKDIFLAVAPAFLHFLECHVSGHALAEMTDGVQDALGIFELGAS